MGTLKGLIDRGKAEEGYIEKASASSLDSKTDNRGDNNYTKYSRDVSDAGLNGCQGQPWCCTFQFWLDLMEYGKEESLKHWNMSQKEYVGYNCFATYNAFKNVGKIGMTPGLGAVAIFNFSHAGRVIRIYSEGGQKWWDCLEGNTSSNLADRNGGQVKIKKRPWNDSSVKGFCYIDYSEPAGWKKGSAGYWYQYADGSYPTNRWELINHHWYLFNRAGQMVTGWHRWDISRKLCDPDDGGGQWYFLDNTSGGDLEGACWHTTDYGAQEIWYVAG